MLIFLSHSSHDSVLAAEVKAWLSDEGYESLFLDFDPEHGIPAGRNWEKELYRQLQLSQAVIALIGERFAASRWCFAEIALARSLGKAILPLRISETPLDPIFSDLQVTDIDDDRDEAFRCLARGLAIAGVEAQKQFQWDPKRSPYPGLLAFQEEDAAVYFGREKDVSQALDMLNRERRYGGPGMLLVLGSSGSGKSSLLRAGVLPRLKRDESQWLVLDPFRPGKEPFKELESVLADAFEKHSDTQEWQDHDEKLRAQGQSMEETVAAFAECVRDLRRRVARESTVIITVDQFEELLDDANPQGGRFLEFLRLALEVSGRPYVVVATLRSDFLESYQKKNLPRDTDAHYLLLGQMKVENLTDVIEKPTRVAGIEIEQALVQALLSDATTDDALPLLAYTLRELYEGYADDNLLEATEYREGLGGLQGSVAKAADSVMSSLPLSEQEEDALRQAFLSLVRIDEAGHYARCAVRWDDLLLIVHPVLERFVKARLLVSRGDGTERVLEVAHEALFRAWDTLSTWLSQNRESLQVRRDLNRAADRWKEGNQSEEYLWRGGRLVRALELRDQGRLTLGENESSFLNASKQKVEWDARRRKRRRLTLVAIAMVVAAAMTGLAILERDSRKEADAQKHVAVSGQLALQSLGRIEEEPDLALLLAIESGKVADTVDARRSLLTALTATKQVAAFLAQSSSSFEALDVSQDGRLLAAGAGYGVRIYDLATKQQVGAPILLTDDILSSILSTAFSPDGKTIAVATVDGVVTLWDVDSRELKGGFNSGQALFIRDLVYSLDGRLLAVPGCADGKFPQCDKGEVALWNVETQRPVGERFVGHTRNVTAVLFGPNGELFTGGNDGTIIVWDIETRRPLVPPLEGHAQRINHLAIQKAGTLFASASADGSVRLWSVAERKAHGDPIRQHEGEVNHVAFFLEGQFLISGGDDGKIIFWNVERGVPDMLIQADTGNLSSLAYDGMVTLISASTDGDLVIWDILSREKMTDTKYFDYEVNDVAVSARGGWVATGDASGTTTVWSGQTAIFTHGSEVPEPVAVSFAPDRPVLAASRCNEKEDGGIFANCIKGEVVLWKIPEGDRIASFTVEGGAVESLEFAPDGKRLAIGASDGRLILKDITTGEDVFPVISAHTERVDAMTFSPDGRRIATASYDKTVKLWNTETGKVEGPPLGDKKGTFLAVDFSPDGRLLAWGGGDREVTIWDVEEMKPIAPPLRAHAGSVFDVAFSPDGKGLATADFTGLILLWDVETQQSIGRLYGHDKAVTALDFDATSLWSSGRDSKVIEWNLDYADWVEVACRVVNRNLSWSEWRQYMGSEDYRRTCDSNAPHPSFHEWGLTLMAAGDLVEGEAVLRKAMALDPSLDIDPDEEIRLSKINSLIARGIHIVDEGQVTEAIGLYKQAEALGSADEISPEAWNSLCWDGTLSGFATEVLYACEYAVRLSKEEDRPFFLDSRGLARAIVGDRVGAAEDFEAFVTWTKEMGIYESHGQLREPWSSALRAGENPIDEAVLNQLKDE